ncbi:hypothetical protein GGI25_003559, partial [Coemansia spiralis]
MSSKNYTLSLDDGSEKTVYVDTSSTDAARKSVDAAYGSGAFDRVKVKVGSAWVSFKEKVKEFHNKGKDKPNVFAMDNYGMGMI